VTTVLVPTTAVDYRARLAGLMRATLADEAAHRDWTYAKVRPMYVPESWRAGQHVRGDCSKGVQYLCRWAGAPDPMKQNYDSSGNSQTLWLRLQHLDRPSDLLVGDIVTFGFDGSEHAAMVFEAGSDPVMWSFGHQGAPNSYRLSADRRAHQYLRNPLPTYVPTKADRLRARTGWFAWMAWALGEGDWGGYGKANRKVRPNVATVIPLSWWRRRARFLLNRKRGG
jgi:hypothetical protein